MLGKRCRESELRPYIYNISYFVGKSQALFLIPKFVSKMGVKATAPKVLGGGSDLPRVTVTQPLGVTL